jgi:hypothetical protein
MLSGGGVRVLLMLLLLLRRVGLTGARLIDICESFVVTSSKRLRRSSLNVPCRWENDAHKTWG